MSFRDLQLHEWEQFSEMQATRYSEELAIYLQQPIVFQGLQRYCCGSRALTIAHFNYAGALFSLIPGGEIQLGYEARDFCPTQAQSESFYESAEEYGIDMNIHSFIQSVTTSPRRVKLPAILVEVRATEIGLKPMSAEASEVQKFFKEYPNSRGVEVYKQYRFKRGEYGSIAAWRIAKKTHEEIETELTSNGLRLLTLDEWEYVCGAGSTTLFRWGDFCPCDRYPTDNTADEARRRTPFEPDEPDWNLHRQPNLFGLPIAQNPYDLEIIADRGKIRGGDGGCSICGGYGFFLGWLPLATAYWDSELMECSEEDEDLSNRFMRRVIPIP